MMNLAFCDYHNIVAILEKTEHNTNFHQIVDFLDASHIRYGLTISPTVYVSHIRQVWSTTRIKTMDQETKIIAIVDGKSQTISESSLRRHLKLNDEEGISSLPDAELFENLSLMGYNILPNQRVNETYKNVSQEIRDQLNAEAEAVQIILTGINNDINSIVDACPNACEMWKAIERSRIGSAEPLQKLSNDDHYNVFAMESVHPEQSKSVHDTYLIGQDAQNVIIDSLDMNYDREEIDQNNDDNYLAKERKLLASLIKKLKCEIDETKNRNKFLETSNKVLIEKLKGEIEDFKNKNISLESSNHFFKEANNRLSEINNLLYADYKKSEAALARRNKMKDTLSAHQETISILSKQKEAQINLYKTREDKELDKFIELETKSRDCSCSKGSVEDKILVPKPSKNYARCSKCGHPVNGPYCQGCAFLREKLEEDLTTYLKYFHDTSESSDDSTNVVNAPRDPFVVHPLMNVVASVVSVQKDNTRGTSKNTKFAKQSILGKPPRLGEIHALSKPVTSNSVPTPQESKVMKNDNVIALGMFRINPFKTSREEKHVPTIVRASARTKLITISQPPVITKKDVNSDSNGLSSIGIDNTKTRRPQPRSNTKKGSPLRLRVVEARIKKLK
nr:hypothetical protein [Tanacetum cinerariifolium]